MVPTGWNRLLIGYRLYPSGLLHNNSVFSLHPKNWSEAKFKSNGLRKLIGRWIFKAAYLTSRLWHGSRSPHLSRFTVRTAGKWHREVWEVSFGE